MQALGSGLILVAVFAAVTAAAGFLAVRLFTATRDTASSHASAGQRSSGKSPDA
jgi:hypothetical protein